jgi:predicted nucleic acid-binding protein
MYLLDTVVLSELRKRQANANVVAWVGSVEATALRVSAATIVEIEFGIERQRKLDPAFAGALAAWLDTMLRIYGDPSCPLRCPLLDAGES